MCVKQVAKQKFEQEMKRLFKYKFIVAFALLAFPFTSCDNEALVELNVDPNNPVSVPPVNLVTQAEYSLNDLLWSRGLNFEWSMLMVQHFAQNEYAEESRYTVDGNNFNTQWSTIYAGVLNELKIAREMIEANEGIATERKTNQLAIIDILTTYAFQNLTDLYGAVPFSQALNSVDSPLPAYDSQQEIYTNLLSMMSSAVSSINESAPSFDSGELIYGGDMSLWKKLGNSLLLRMAMRVVDVDSGLASQYITSAAGGSLISSNAENAVFVFGADANIANPMYRDAIIGTRDDFAVTDVLVNTLTDLGDPRLEQFAKPNPSGNIVGMPYGLTDGEAFALKSTTSRPNDALREATAPAVIMDYAEVQFLLAEAYERGIVSGDAAAAYAEGISASMMYWGISDDAAIDAYVAANAYDAGNWKESIGTQKWIAFYMNGPQAWAEWRRLDYPVLEVPAAATNDVIPVRLPYPVDEQTRNASSLSEVTSTPNDMSTKLWWDVN